MMMVREGAKMTTFVSGGEEGKPVGMGLRRDLVFGKRAYIGQSW
jgi:hypothetical protein